MAPSASERHPARLPAISMPVATLIAFAVGLDVYLANKRIPHTHTYTESGFVLRIKCWASRIVIIGAK